VNESYVNDVNAILVIEKVVTRFYCLVCYTRFFF